MTEKNHRLGIENMISRLMAEHKITRTEARKMAMEISKRVRRKTAND